MKYSTIKILSKYYTKITRRNILKKYCRKKGIWHIITPIILRYVFDNVVI